MWDKTADSDEKEVSLSVDDLILEIGRKYIEGLIAEKKLNIWKDKANAIAAKMNSMLAEASKLKESNTAYVENNKKFDIAVTELRAENKTLKEKVATLELRDSTLRSEVSSREEKIRNISLEAERYKKEKEALINEFSLEIESLKKEIAINKLTKSRKKK